MNSLSFAYPPARQGYWHPITSTLNWCEEDYYATFYVAEIINTLTNLLFMYLAYKGFRNCTKHGHDFIFFVAFVGYILVGIGSFCFHATLTYPMQLVDELSMIYTTCLMCYATFSHSTSRAFSVFLAVFLILLAVFITVYYHYLQDPVFHQNAYALLTTIVVFRSMYLMEVNLRPSFRSSDRNRDKAVNDRDLKILRSMWLMVACGLTLFIGGFGIWSLDSIYCPELRAWRRKMGLPWGILLEGHGWWHIGTGLGAYFYITWAIWLRHCLNGRQEEYELDWPSAITTLPQIVRSERSDTRLDSKQAHSNGKARKKQ